MTRKLRVPLSALTTCLVALAVIIAVTIPYLAQQDTRDALNDSRAQLAKAQVQIDALTGQLEASQRATSCRSQIASTTDGAIIDFLLSTADPVKYPYADAVDRLVTAGAVRRDTATRCGS